MNIMKLKHNKTILTTLFISVILIVALSLFGEFIIQPQTVKIIVLLLGLLAITLSFFALHNHHKLSDIAIEQAQQLRQAKNTEAQPQPVTDNTQQKKLQAQLDQSQKMQAVGQLAGGIAHDFNNLLTAIIGFCDLLLARHPAGDKSFPDIMQIKQNSNRAANLVRQLLAFSRRQTLQPSSLNLTDVLTELSHLIRRLIGQNISLNINHGQEINHIYADQGQIEQVIINLAVNARDAMPDGGQITIETQNITINSSTEFNKYFCPDSDDLDIGNYVQLTIADNGTGIEQQHLKQIFEPFFSTKKIGAGTGLGLATVYGIVKQTNGHIFIETELNKGTKFYVLFKKHTPQDKPTINEEAAKDKPEFTTDLSGEETILLVEDEKAIRSLATRALEKKGYKIIAADCGEAGLDMYKQHHAEINLILSDVMMPGITGTEFVRQALEISDDVKVVLMSGYAEDVIENAPFEYEFLPKPFNIKSLAEMVKNSL